MVTKKRELSRDEILRSFHALPDDATVEDFIDHLANVAGVGQRLAEGKVERISDSGSPDRMNKKRLLESLGKLRHDATVDDFAYRLYVISKVERGLAASRAGNKITQEEARERLKRWLR